MLVDCIECMAASDNVVRAGLTPKYQDVDTLVRMLTYDYGPAEEQKMLGDPVYKNTKHSRLYDPPIEEFSILKTSLAAGESEEVPAIAGPSILVVTEGKGVIGWREGDNAKMEVAKGFIVFIGANCPVNISSDSSFTAYRAYCEI
jgi:mannose-6-phosphate isomerase